MRHLPKVHKAISERTKAFQKLPKVFQERQGTPKSGQCCKKTVFCRTNGVFLQQAGFFAGQENPPELYLQETRAIQAQLQILTLLLFGKHNNLSYPEFSISNLFSKTIKKSFPAPKDSKYRMLHMK